MARRAQHAYRRIARIPMQARTFRHRVETKPISPRRRLRLTCRNQNDFVPVSSAASRLHNPFFPRTFRDVTNRIDPARAWGPAVREISRDQIILRQARTPRGRRCHQIPDPAKSFVTACRILLRADKIQPRASAIFPHFPLSRDLPTFFPFMWLREQNRRARGERIPQRGDRPSVAQFGDNVRGGGRSGAGPPIARSCDRVASFLLVVEAVVTDFESVCNVSAK